VTKNGRDLPNTKAEKKGVQQNTVPLLRIRRELWSSVRLRPPHVVRIQRQEVGENVWTRNECLGIRGGRLKITIGISAIDPCGSDTVLRLSLPIGPLDSEREFTSGSPTATLGWDSKVSQGSSPPDLTRRISAVAAGTAPEPASRLEGG